MPKKEIRRHKTFITLDIDVIEALRKQAIDDDLSVSKKIERIVIGKDKPVIISKNKPVVLVREV